MFSKTMESYFNKNLNKSMFPFKKLKEKKKKIIFGSTKIKSSNK